MLPREVLTHRRQRFRRIAHWSAPHRSCRVWGLRPTSPPCRIHIVVLVKLQRFTLPMFLNAALGPFRSGGAALIPRRTQKSRGLLGVEAKLAPRVNGYAEKTPWAHSGRVCRSSSQRQPT